MNIVQASLRK